MKRNHKDMLKESKRSRYESYIENQGFKIIRIQGDGNCLFRAIAHQLEGSEQNYSYYRSLAVDYMTNNPEKFNNFLLDESACNGNLDKYIENMSQDKVWGGHMEIYALSEQSIERAAAIPRQ